MEILSICPFVCLFVCHHFSFNRYHGIGRSNQKDSKNKVHFFQILLLGGPSPPSQLVPNPFNWSPSTGFYRYLGIGRSNKKNKKKRCAFFSSNFGTGRTLPTQSTGPQTPFFTYISVSVAQIKQFQKTRCIFFKFCFLEDPPHPVNWSKTHSTGPKTLFLAPPSSALVVSQFQDPSTIHRI